MIEESFSMSMFASEKDLYKAKAEYFESKYKEHTIKLLMCEKKMEMMEINKKLEKLSDSEQEW